MVWQEEMDVRRLQHNNRQLTILLAQRTSVSDLLWLVASELRLNPVAGDRSIESKARGD